MANLLEPDHSNQAVAADIAKWFTAATPTAPIGAQEIVHVLGVYGSVTVAEAGKVIVLSDEDAATPFLTIALDVAGEQIATEFPEGMVVLAKGKDIKADTTATTGIAELNIVIGKRT